MSLLLHGIAVSRGIAIGKVRVLQRDRLELSESPIAEDAVEREIDSFQRALDTASGQLRQLREHVPSNMPVDVGAFIDTHLMMLNDPMLREGPIGIIREQMCNAAWALKLQRDSLVAVFEAMDDSYLRTRKDDVDHVVGRIHSALSGTQEDAATQAGSDWRGCVVVADDLTPADTIVMQHHGVAGFVTESGGQLSHTAILARGLGIPAVVGIHHARRYLHDGESIIVDGRLGLILAEADTATLQSYQNQLRELRRRRKALTKIREAGAVTADGTEIALRANMEVSGDLRAIKQVNADGVGLYRTEYLYMNRQDLPNEDEHFRAYRHLVKALGGRHLTIRTVDIGADKEVETVASGPLAHNPAMGLRGIRRCLNEPSLFLPQLLAILRASAYGPVRILLPMLTAMDEIRQVQDLLDEARAQLKRRRQDFDTDIAVGGMIEVPAAAVAAEQFARHLDFLSIGTNDLIQYTLAIDRIDDQVNYLYDPLHPAVLSLIDTVIKAGKRHQCPVSMCGEMAGDVRYTRLLLGLGLRDLSMPANSLLAVKQTLLHSHAGKLRRPAQAIARCGDNRQQQTLLHKLNRGLDDLDLPL